jgi:hypothetical protein
VSGLDASVTGGGFSLGREEVTQLQGSVLDAPGHLARITVQGAIDLHLHSFPCLFPRVGNDREIVEAAQGAGMHAIVLKCHHESTVSRAYLLDQESSTLRVFGGIVLNYPVGGINPSAVEAALVLGGKIVWMPTVDSAFHREIYGATGGYDRQRGSVRSSGPGITIIKQGTLTPEAQEVIRLIADHGAILGTSHIAPEEIRLLVVEARKAGVEKILIMHPLFRVPRLTMEQIAEVVSHGAILELDYCGISPMWAEVKLDDLVHLVRTFGPNQCVLVSDGGQTHNPMPCQALRLLAQNLHERGITEEELRKMMVDLPKQLLGV